MTNFLRRLRYAYAKRGEKLCYIQVTEYLNNKLHHHLIINSVDEVILKHIQNKIWKLGFCHATPLSDNDAFNRLVSYLIKETSKTFNFERRFFGKRWTVSKGLRLPESIDEITNGTKSDIETIPAFENFNGDIYDLIKGSENVNLNEYGAFCFYILKKRE